VRIAALDAHEHDEDNNNNNNNNHNAADEQKQQRTHNEHTHTHTHADCIYVAERLSMFLRDYVLPRAKTTKTMLISDQKVSAVHAYASVKVCFTMCISYHTCTILYCLFVAFF